MKTQSTRAYPLDIEQAGIIADSQACGIAEVWGKLVAFWVQIKEARRYEQVTGRCSRCGRSVCQKK